MTCLDHKSRETNFVKKKNIKKLKKNFNQYITVKPKKNFKQNLSKWNRFSNHVSYIPS